MASKWVLMLVCAFVGTKAQSGYSRDNPTNQLGYNPFGQTVPSDDALNGDEIPGEAGRDYPIYSEVPRTGFSCSNQQYSGYYADPEAQCQVYYICQKDGKGNGFLCPNGTIFNQEYLTCDWWYNVDCNRAQQLYSVNEMVVRAMEEADARLRQQQQSGYSYNAPGFVQTPNTGNQNGIQRPSYDITSNRRNFNGLSANNQNSFENRGQNSGTAYTPQNPITNRPNTYNNNGYSPSPSGFQGSNQNNVRTNQNFGTPNVRINTARPNPIGGNAPGIQYTPTNGGSNYYSNFNGNRNTGVTPNRTYLPPVENNLNTGYSIDSNDIRNGQQNYQTDVRIPDRTYLPPTGNGGANASPSSQFAPRRGNASGGFNLNEPNAYNGVSQGSSNSGNNGYGSPDRRYLPPSK